MIAIKIVSGPHAGKRRVVRDGKHQGRKVDPLKLLRSLIGLGSRWEIEYTQADDNEAFEWGRIDYTARMFRALIERRPVYFMGVAYLATPENLEHVLEVLETAIVQSGYTIRLEYDDERGVSIATGATEHKLQ